MTKCNECGRDMCNFNIRFCSVACREGNPVVKEGWKLPMLQKYPSDEVNVGLTRPQGGEVILPKVNNA